MITLLTANLSLCYYCLRCFEESVFPRTYSVKRQTSPERFWQPRTAAIKYLSYVKTYIVYLFIYRGKRDVSRYVYIA